MFPTAKGIIINPKIFLFIFASKSCSFCPNCRSPNCEDPKTRQFVRRQLHSMIRRPNIGHRSASSFGKLYGRDKLISHSASQADVHVDHVSPPPPPPPPHHHHHHVIPLEVPVIEPHSSSNVAHEMQSESVPDNIVCRTVAVAKPHRLRGVTLGIQVENDPELRPLCLISDNSFITEKARNKCWPILKRHINEHWVLWKQVPEDVFEGCWEEFSTEYSTEVGGPAEDGTPEVDDVAIWIEKTGGIKKNRILGLSGYRAQDVLGTPPIVPPSISYSSPQQSIDPKELENMIDKIVLRRLGIKSMDDASTDDSTPQPSIGIDITEHVTKLVEKFTNFLQTFTSYDSLEEELYRPNLDFLEENDDEVDQT